MANNTDTSSWVYFVPIATVVVITFLVIVFYCIVKRHIMTHKTTSNRHVMDITLTDHDHYLYDFDFDLTSNDGDQSVATTVNSVATTVTVIAIEENRADIGGFKEYRRSRILTATQV